jgi:hypothetical protein
LLTWRWSGASCCHLLQVEQSAGLISKVTRGLLEEHFSQMKEVSAMFVQHMQDSSRRSCGVQATEELGTSMSAVAAAAAAGAGDQQPQPWQQQQQHPSVDGTEKHVLSVTAKVREQSPLGQQLREGDEYSAEEFDGLFSASMDPAAAAAAAAQDAGVGWSAVLPQDVAHPVLQFEALLRAEQVAARSTTAVPVAAEAAGGIAAASDYDSSDVPEEPRVADIADIAATSAASVGDMDFLQAPDAASTSAAVGSVTDNMQYEDEFMGAYHSLPVAAATAASSSALRSSISEEKEQAEGAAAAGSSALRSSIAEEAAAIVARALASSGGSLLTDDPSSSGSSSSGGSAVGEEGGIQQQYGTSSFESYEDSGGGGGGGGAAAAAGAKGGCVAPSAGSALQQQQQQQQPLRGEAELLEVGMELDHPSKMLCDVALLECRICPVVGK